MFHNRIDEVLGELFQNSQRAGATRVEITTTDHSFTISDNGHGLIGNVEGFHTLLKIAESRFDNETVEDQDPMGLGIVSLLTHDQVTEVTFNSASLELTIDTKRWWNDPDYYSVWYERLLSLDQPVSGLRISVTCKPELVKAIHASLKGKDILYSFSDDAYQSVSPAQGYEGILTITLNSENVRTSLPTWTTIPNRLISTTFKGSKLNVGYTNTHRSSVLWYGQLIILRGLTNSAFSFHLEVTSGRPINPLSPSRAGVINDDAYTELLNFVKAQIFNFVFDPKNRNRIKPAHVEACYQLDNEYATANSPYFVAASVEINESFNSFEEFNGTADFNPATLELFTYAAPPLLLNDGVTVQLTTRITHAEHGLHSFLTETGPVYTLRCGDVNRVKIGTLWWKPEGTPIHDWFYGPGAYGISYNDDNPPDDWQTITTTPVFAFDNPNGYDADQVDFIVGSTAPLDFLNDQVWAGFSINEEDDNTDAQEESYRNSVDHIIRSIIGNCVPRDFNFYQVSQFLKDQSAPIMSVVYHYKIAGKFVNPRRAYKPSKQNTGGAMSPSEITVKSATGEKVRLKLY